MMEWVEGISSFLKKTLHWIFHWKIDDRRKQNTDRDRLLDRERLLDRDMYRFLDREINRLLNRVIDC